MMHIVWHGHSCFEINNGTVIVVDPHDGRSLGIKPPSAAADIVLISHDHFDHNSFKSIRGSHKDMFAFAGEFEFGGCVFEGLQSDHDGMGGTKRGKNVMYKMKIDGVTICHCGDLGNMPDDDVICKIRNTDILMVPVGGVYTMDTTDVIRFIDAVRPRIIIPMHYRVGGLSIPLNSVDSFINVVGHNVEYVGNEIDFSADELPQETTVWVFSR
ncbi:MAG: MBL fold metallo-hydrolase [Methanomassiliicoccaceae archaeon]|jgi:L-ascorbate metabolism protein UlaG (beta-lactamase superfamily)|nr:MBL fold metallo-hydrolase [Methanomassiliicoccaceae archaeon]